MHVSTTTPCKRLNYHDLTSKQKETYKRRVDNAVRGQQEIIGPNVTVSNTWKKTIQAQILQQIAVESGAAKKGKGKILDSDSHRKIKNRDAIIAAAEKVVVRKKDNETKTIPTKVLPSPPVEKKRQIEDDEICDTAKTFSETTLVNQIKMITDRIATEKFMAGTEKNSFYPMLATWKEKIGELQERLWEAQQMKNSLDVLSLEIDSDNDLQYDPEYSRLLFNLWEKQADLESFLGKHEEDHWTELLRILSDMRNESKPKPLSDKCQKTLDRISQPTSSETLKEAKEAEEAGKKLLNRIRVNDINYRYSLWCYHTLKSTCEIFKWRINENNTRLDYPNIKDFHPSTKPFKTSSTHILSERKDNNHQHVIDRVINVNAQVLAAKEIMDSTLNALSSMSSQYQLDYVTILRDLRTILTQNLINLRKEIKDSNEEAEKAIERLERVRDEEDVEGFNARDMEYINTISKNDPHSANPLFDSAKKHNLRKAAANTQIRILKAFMKNTETRMSKEEGYAGLLVKISLGVEPLFDKFCRKVTALEELLEEQS